MTVIAREQWKRQPWKNGKGVTWEVLRVAAGDGPDGYELRASLAEDPEPATFSTFPGYVRWSFLAGAAPIVLAQEGGVAIELQAMGDHVRTPGEIVMSSQLPAGPTLLFNVLVKSGAAYVVGYGPSAHPVRFVFAIAEQRAEWFDEPAQVETTGCVWIT